MPRGWTAVVGPSSDPKRRFVLVRRRGPSQPFVVRGLSFDPDRTPVHPVIVPDPTKDLFHLCWTGYRADTPGQLLYGVLPILPKSTVIHLLWR